MTVRLTRPRLASQIHALFPIICFLLPPQHVNAHNTVFIRQTKNVKTNQTLQKILQEQMDVRYI